MVDLQHRLPGIDVVTVLTNIRGGDMLQALTGGRDAVMATATVFSGAGVLKGSWHPGVGAVAVITGICTGNMAYVLTTRRYAIVAAYTGPQHLEVVDQKHRRPARGAVAIFADICGFDVIRPRTGGLYTVVAARAVPGNPAVIEECRNPCIRCVAQFTGFAGLQMAGGYARLPETIVATLTTAQSLAVVKPRDGLPPDLRVAILALVGSLYMI